MVLPGYIIEAAWHNDLDTIRDWLDNGGDINDTEDGTGVTIVNIGAVNEEFETVKWAISRGADVNKPDEDGLTPLFNAVGNNRRRAKPETLLAAVARLPNEMAWHVLSFWPAEADVAPPSTPSPRPPPIISDEALLSELDGLVQAQKAQRGGG